MSESIVMLFVGMVTLIVGAEFAVRCAVAVASKLHVPAAVIGLTALSFGTSIPEFTVSMRSALRGASGIAIGNVVGANIANVMLILGFAAMISPLKCSLKTFVGDYVFLMLVTAVFTLFAFSGEITMAEGFVLLGMLLAFLVYNYRNSKFNDFDAENADTNVASSWLSILLMCVFGVAGIAYGSDWLLDSAVDIAQRCGVSHDLIGLTLIAFGTSVPELATTTVAALRKQADVAIGNVMGSNIWNILFIMGATASSADIVVPDKFLRFDIWIMIVSSASLMPVIYRTRRFSRLDGLTFFFGYAVYMMLQILIANGDISF